MAQEQRRLAAIVAIDVVGYSRLMGRNESGTHALLKAHFAQRVMPSFGRHGGRVVKSTGDGVPLIAPFTRLQRHGRSLALHQDLRAECRSDMCLRCHGEVAVGQGAESTTA